MVADEGHLIGDFRLQRIPQRRAVSAVGHRHDDVGLDGVLARQLPPQFHSHPVNASIGDGAVGPGKIDVLKNGEGPALLQRKSLDAARPAPLLRLLVDHHDFPGSTSRTNLAWIKSNAQVSLASTQASPTRPMQRGRNPKGSRNPTNSCSVIITTE